jgi:hypothetical protein
MTPTKLWRRNSELLQSSIADIRASSAILERVLLLGGVKTKERTVKSLGVIRLTDPPGYFC